MKEEISRLGESLIIDAEKRATGPNPSRDEQITLLLELVKKHHPPGTLLLDLGGGTGLVSEALLKSLPSLEIVLVDSSPVMLSIAKQKLSGFNTRVSFVLGDMAELDPGEFAMKPVGTIIAVQSLQMLPENSKKKVFKLARDLFHSTGKVIRQHGKEETPPQTVNGRTCKNTGIFIIADRLGDEMLDGDPTTTILWTRTILESLDFTVEIKHRYEYRTLLVAYCES